MAKHQPDQRSSIQRNFNDLKYELQFIEKTMDYFYHNNGRMSVQEIENIRDSIARHFENLMFLIKD